MGPQLSCRFPILLAAPHLWKDFQADASTTGGPEGQPCVGVWIDGGHVSLCQQQLAGMFADTPAAEAHINTWELFVCI
jgi:hypothetical protein